MNPHTDACPRCDPGDAPAALPLSFKAYDHGELTTHRCTACGHAWTCWWDSEAAGWPVTRREAA